MGDFYIKHDKQSIQLETVHSKFDSLERIMLIAGDHFIKKGQTDRLKSILGTLEEMVFNSEDKGD